MCLLAFARGICGSIGSKVMLWKGSGKGLFLGDMGPEGAQDLMRGRCVRGVGVASLHVI